MAVDHAAQGIRVNALVGVIDTPMPARSLKRYADPEAMKAFWKHRHPMGRIGKPEEVARAALFLASDDFSFVTGTLLFVDGGWTALMPRKLTPGQIAGYERDGYVCPVDGFSTERARAWRDRMEAFERAEGQKMTRGHNFKPHLLFPQVDEIVRAPRCSTPWKT